MSLNSQWIHFQKQEMRIGQSCKILIDSLSLGEQSLTFDVKFKIRLRETHGSCDGASAGVAREVEALVGLCSSQMIGALRV